MHNLDLLQVSLSLSYFRQDEKLEIEFPVTAWYKCHVKVDSLFE